MATITETREKELETAVEEVDDANRDVDTRQSEVEAAQRRAREMEGFPAAAQLEYDNAEARYRVLDESAKSTDAHQKDLRDKLDRLQNQLTAAEEELAGAKALEASVKVISVATQLITSAKEAESTLPATARNSLGKTLDTLQTELDAAQRKVEDVSDVPNVKELQKKVSSLKRERTKTQNQQKAEHPTVSSEDLQQAKSERNNARLQLQEAPEAVRVAQADLDAKQAKLAEAKEAQKAALDRLDKVQAEYVARIMVGTPDANGMARARALLKPGKAIPDGFRLGWQAGGAPVRRTDEQGLEVIIDATTLPPGVTDVVAHLERIPEKH
jgi:chromosome segregation ATPase